MRTTPAWRAAGADTRLLHISAHLSRFITDSTHRVPQKVTTLSCRVDECKPLESVKERGRITADLRANRKTGNRNKGEFWRARQGGH